MHRDFWNSKPQKEPFSLFGGRDRDSAVILPLLVLLLSDGGDELLILALIYILS